MTENEIIYEANKILSLRKLSAEKKAADNFSRAKLTGNFSELYGEMTEILIKAAKCGKNSAEYSELLKKYDELSAKINELLKGIGLSMSDLSPNYVCKKCGDTGIINGVECDCRSHLVKKLREKALGGISDGVPPLSKVNSDFIKEKDKESYEKLCGSFVNFTKKYPNTTVRYLVFFGATGTGKTYFAKAIAKELEKKGKFATVLSAFSLNNDFLKCHTDFDRKSGYIIEHLIETDILVVDDLGTEPIYRNVSREYLTNLVNERNARGKITIITTNLAPDMILERYGERLYSRLFDKNFSKAVYFPFENLRK